MAYIGVQPADAYTSFAVQHFTTSATTSYTLDNPVANENEIALFINNVRQQPGSSYAYTASGTTLTLSAATSASDTMYCVFIGKAVQTVTPANGSVTNDMLAGSINESKLLGSIPNSKLANSSITLNGSAVSLGGSATVGGTNTPAFMMYATAQTTINSGAVTKIALGGSYIDTDSAVDTTNSRFTVPTGKGGKYIIGGALNLDAKCDSFHIGIYVNGSHQYDGLNNWLDYGNDFSANSRTIILDLSAGDYVEMYTLQVGTTRTTNGTHDRTRMWGYKLIT